MESRGRRGRGKEYVIKSGLILCLLKREREREILSGSNFIFSLFVSKNSFPSLSQIILSYKIKSSKEKKALSIIPDDHGRVHKGQSN